MIGLVVRLEYYRQSLRRRLLSIFSISGASGNEYHIILIFLVAVLAIPVVGSDIATGPVGGLGFLGAETGIFLTILFLAVTFMMTVVFFPLGGLLL